MALDEKYIFKITALRRLLQNSARLVLEPVADTTYCSNKSVGSSKNSFYKEIDYLHWNFTDNKDRAGRFFLKAVETDLYGTYTKWLGVFA